MYNQYLWNAEKPQWLSNLESHGENLPRRGTRLTGAGNSPQNLSDEVAQLPRWTPSQTHPKGHRDRWVDHSLTRRGALDGFSGRWLSASILDNHRGHLTRQASGQAAV
jgi:hypothetical protein